MSPKIQSVLPAGERFSPNELTANKEIGAYSIRRQTQISVSVYLDKSLQREERYHSYRSANRTRRHQNACVELTDKLSLMSKKKEESYVLLCQLSFSQYENSGYGDCDYDSGNSPNQSVKQRSVIDYGSWLWLSCLRGRWTYRHCG
jgi:hypothetical protein